MTLPPPLQSIETAPSPKLVRAFVPELKWPSLDCSHAMVDLPQFPSSDEEERRYRAGEFGAWSEAFMSTVRRARSQVWVIDDFLLKINQRAGSQFSKVFDSVLGETLAQDIRLLTSGKDGQREQIDDLRVLQDLRRAPPRNEPFTIEVRFIRKGRSCARLPHDRFAIIDEELWHWGANVGGTHHQVNAYSRGWSAYDTGATEYFKRLWKDAEVVL